MAISWGYIHWSGTSTDVGIWALRMSLEKARTLPYSGVGQAKEGTTKCCPQINRVYGDGWSTQITRGDLSVSGRVAILYSLDWALVPYRAASRVKSAGKAARVLSIIVDTLCTMEAAWCEVMTVLWMGGAVVACGVR